MPRVNVTAVYRRYPVSVERWGGAMVEDVEWWKGRASQPIEAARGCLCRLCNTPILGGIYPKYYVPRYDDGEPQTCERCTRIHLSRKLNSLGEIPKNKKPWWFERAYLYAVCRLYLQEYSKWTKGARQ